MVKAVLFFLLVMVVVAMVSNAVAPGGFWRGIGRATGMRRCPRCGRPRVGKSGCDCERDG